jgi:molecular chaperone GrpE
MTHDHDRYPPAPHAAAPDGPGGGAGAAAGTPTDVETVARERDELQERLLRTAAEFENYRKRTDRERRELSEAASLDLIRELLPVVDDLERALAAAAAQPSSAPAAEAFLRGVELIHRQVLEVLRRRGVEPIDVVGHDFDPAWHEAVATDPLDGRRPGEITHEVRRGYRIGHRLVRPAMVKVAQA